jgi:hypothetical protein
MAFAVFVMFFCAVTGMGSHLILEYQKSVTTHASHSADSWVHEQSFNTKNRSRVSGICAVF